MLTGVGGVGEGMGGDGAGWVCSGVFVADTPEASTGEVWGSLIPLLKGLNNQLGVSLEARVLLVPAEAFMLASFADAVDFSDRTECMEDWEGDVLR
jgi:hypothetical protein